MPFRFSVAVRAQARALFYAGDADAGIVALGDKPWEQVKLAIRAASGRRIQDAFNLLRIARLRLHQHSQAL